MSQPTTTLNEEESRWVNECAGRLRLIQADAATLPAEKRREYLQEEMERSLKNTPPANRKRYLQALLQRFPVAGQIATAAPAVAAPSPPAPLSSQELFDRFLDAATKMSEEERTDYSRRLQQAGLVRVDREALVIEVSKELRQTLGIKPEEKVRLSRVVELAIGLADIFTRLEHTALTALRDLSPKSRTLRQPRDFCAAAGRFLVAGEETLEAQTKAAAGLLGALLWALSDGGREFGREFVEQMSPTAIEQVVRDEGKAVSLFGKKPKELCWEKYTELFNDYYATPELVDRKIKNSLGAFVERKVLGGR